MDKIKEIESEIGDLWEKLEKAGIAPSIKSMSEGRRIKAKLEAKLEEKEVDKA